MAGRWRLDFEEADAAAQLALCEAAEEFDPARGVTWEAFACRRVQAACLTLL